MGYLCHSTFLGKYSDFLLDIDPGQFNPLRLTVNACCQRISHSVDLARLCLLRKLQESTVVRVKAYLLSYTTLHLRKDSVFVYLKDPLPLE